METKVDNLFRVTVTEFEDGVQRPLPELTKYFTDRIEANAYARTQDVWYCSILCYRTNVERCF